MIIRLIVTVVLTSLLVACGGSSQAPESEDSHGAAAADEFERGPHRGRTLRDGDFAIEVALLESGAQPQFRVYAYQNDRPLSPGEVVPTIELKRLDGEVNRLTFKPEGDFLTGSDAVLEPHSFDVKVTAQYAGKMHHWSYASHEGRTTIPAAIAEEAGVRVEVAGPAVIHDQVPLVGNVALNENRHADIKARFPGIVRAVHVQQGDQVRRGQTLVVVEGNESMRRYPVVAPFDGVVLARNTNIGDVAGDGALIELADLSDVWIELHAIGKDAARLASGQRVHVESATGDAEGETVIQTLLPLATRGQSVIARASLPNPDGQWRPGMTVSAKVTVSDREVPLAVLETGLQRFRDHPVVFAQFGDVYEVRMLELGVSDGEVVEVLDGLKPGTAYVSEQSYLIKADIEKSGASHDH
ncbi:efflux RND transporter periplasmic adaptor subunit [Dokdonella sp.]|uniref:efflux RND transporter periplasmic adaptor subunit n=1 Tax=Dokdonella sp. TaxID=2291710 RepID=UPI003C427055